MAETSVPLMRVFVSCYRMTNEEPMFSILRLLGPILFSTVGRFGIFFVFIAFNRYGRRFWRWFWE